MAYEQEPFQIRVIALDFYDGATEGFALSVGELEACYFKLIAWDEDQDHRLFVVVSIARLVFDTIFGLLSNCNDPPSTKIWLPEWNFRNRQDEAEANKLMESCKIDMKSRAILVLGNQVDSASSDMFALNDSLISFVERAMKNPESLDDWLVKLKRGNVG